MTYLQPHSYRPHRSAQRAAIGAATLVVLAVAAVAYFMPHLFPGIFMTAVQPFWRAEVSISEGSLRSPASLLIENETLKRKIAESAVEQKTVQAVLDENAELKALLGRASTTPLVLAAVLRHPAPGLFDELVIDAGTDHGFEPGDKVYAPGQVLIGSVPRILDASAIVKLFSSPDRRYDVMLGPHHVPASAIGKGGGQYSASLPRNAGVSEGDFVIAPSLYDKPFGIVSNISMDPAEPFETVLFAPPVNIYQLRWVLVDPRNNRP